MQPSLADGVCFGIRMKLAWSVYAIRVKCLCNLSRILMELESGSYAIRSRLHRLRNLFGSSL